MESPETPVGYIKECLLDVFIKCDTTRGAFVLVFGLFCCNDTPSSPKSPQSRETWEKEELFERFKSYLDRKGESIASGLAFETTSGTQKLERAAEVGKLKFQGNKDQFPLNSELQGTRDDAANFLAPWNIEKAGVTADLDPPRGFGPPPPHKTFLFSNLF